MNMVRNKIIYAVIICLLSSFAYSSSNPHDNEYTPRASGRSLFKTALVGLTIMAMPKPVESACYIGTVNPQDPLTMDYIKIISIKSAPCNFYYDYPPSAFKNINMTMSISCRMSIPSCVGITIDKVNICGVSGGNPYSLQMVAELRWDYLGRGQYEKFALNILSGLFGKADEAFRKFMSTGKCDSTTSTASSAPLSIATDPSDSSHEKIMSAIALLERNRIMRI
jgi:hypothetical protein